MKISIVIPSYNDARYLGKTLDSIRAQNDPDCEVIIIDGGSSDDTKAVVDGYMDIVTLFVSEPDKGQSDALNKGFALATGEIMAWMCANDYYLDGAFARVRRHFSKHTPSQFLYGDGIRVDEQGQWIRDVKSGPVLDYDNFVNYNYVFSTTAFWKREIWLAAGSFVDIKNNWTMDWELFVRMSKVAKLDYCPGFVAALRSHADAKTTQGGDAFKRARDFEIFKVSLKHGGFLCFNVLVFPAIWCANQVSRFDFLPRPLFRWVFIGLHLPARLIPRNKHSIYFNGKRI